MGKRIRAAFAAATLVMAVGGSTICATSQAKPTQGNTISKEPAVAFRVFGRAKDERETLVYLWEWAQRFSGMQSLYGADGYNRFPIYMVSKADLAKTICPESPGSCEQMAAVYDTSNPRILMRKDMDPISNDQDASFLLHELVHALQGERMTEDQMYGTCQRLKKTEDQAYHAQDMFLAMRSDMLQPSHFMRFFLCGKAPMPS